jgi:hypothetical protein
VSFESKGTTDGEIKTPHRKMLVNPEERYAEGVPFHAIRVDEGFASIESTRFCKWIRLGRRYWACVDLARVVSAFVDFANRPVKLIGLCKAAPRPFRNI